MSAADFLPKKHDLKSLRNAAADCQGCPLYQNATQTVFGEGPANARVVMVGEVPGDMEDRKGKPFVGPAGKLLDEALQEARVDRDTVYVTNAVKHFKFKIVGGRRLHQKPGIREMKACKPWLEAEFEAIQPEIVICLGATAAQSVISTDFRITKQRGEVFHTDYAPVTLATYHPSAILRAPDRDARASMYELLVEDLRTAARHLKLAEKKSAARKLVRG
jgi:DNA polymerase